MEEILRTDRISVGILYPNEPREYVVVVKYIKKEICPRIWEKYRDSASRKDLGSTIRESTPLV